MSLNTTIASAPGKILLVGGYAVLERPNVSLSVAINAFVHAKITPSEDDNLHLSCMQIEYSKSFSQEEITSSSHTGSGKFVCNAVKYVLLYLKAKRITIRPFNLSTQSDDSFNVGFGKSGLGSSAAVTVATVAAILKLHGITAKDIIHNLSQISHSVSQGKIGSGFDVATSTFGSITYTRYSPDAFDIARLSDPIYLVSCVEQSWDCRITPFNASHLDVLIGNIKNTSTSTTEMVRKIIIYKQSHPQDYAVLMRSLNESNAQSISFLASNDLEGASTHLSHSMNILETLGKNAGCDIIPAQLNRIMQESNAGGSSVTLLPGAGGGDSIVSLFTKGTSKDAVRVLWEANSIEPLELSLEVKGVHAHSL